jgi:hypothetical protein
MSARRKQIALRLPKEMIAKIREVAKQAGVTPTQAINVILALEISRYRQQ